MKKFLRDLYERYEDQEHAPEIGKNLDDFRALQDNYRKKRHVSQLLKCSGIQPMDFNLMFPEKPQSKSKNTEALVTKEPSKTQQRGTDKSSKTKQPETKTKTQKESEKHVEKSLVAFLEPLLKNSAQGMTPGQVQPPGASTTESHITLQDTLPSGDGKKPLESTNGKENAANFEHQKQGTSSQDNMQKPAVEKASVSKRIVETEDTETRKKRPKRFDELTLQEGIMWTAAERRLVGGPRRVVPPKPAKTDKPTPKSDTCTTSSAFTGTGSCNIT